MTDLADLYIKHHFGGGVYAKETVIPTGHRLVQHRHKFEHLSILADGHALVDGKVCRGPIVLTMKAGYMHEVVALTACIWYCIHATEETDPIKVDQVLISST